MSKILGLSFLLAGFVISNFKNAHAIASDQLKIEPNMSLQAEKLKVDFSRPKPYINGTAKAIPIPTCWDAVMIRVENQNSSTLKLKNDNQYKCIGNNQVSKNDALNRKR
jgi:hypothetical protein